jgi:D-apionolactonase
MLPRHVLYYGKDEPLPARQPLRAGPLTAFFEEGGLRYIRLGDREVLRRIYIALRDQNWGTVPTTISNLQVEQAADSFEISYDAENKQGEVDFAWTGRITGNAEGKIEFRMDGKARSPFLRNRIGFNVLHPIRECAGQECEVEKVDGSVTRSEFPRFISPQQPFRDMRAISHQVVRGVRAEVRFSGDIFEMEDQRNWTDASYKTYCTPLSLPFPVEVRAGTRISQTVSLSLKGGIPRVQTESKSSLVTVSSRDMRPMQLPRLGVGMASHGQPLSRKELARLRALNLSHLRVDLRLSDPKYESDMRRAAMEARSLDVPLEVALILSDEADKELVGLRARIEEIKPDVRTWSVFDIAEKSTSKKWVALARRRLADYNSQAGFGAGTNAYFAELNRGRPGPDGVDLVSYSINPQVHAFDNASLVESLEAQASTVESARQFLGGIPIAVSPVTLKPRFNPNATGPEPEPSPGELPSQVDVRQMSLFGAGRTLGSIKYLAESGAASVTYYETTGWRGVMESEQGSMLPERFRSLPGAVFPLYHVLADVGEFAEGGVAVSTSSAPLRVEGLVLCQGGRTRILLANFEPEPQKVRVLCTSLTKTVQVKQLDETNVEAAMTSPEMFRTEPGRSVDVRQGELELTLAPYAVARIDSISQGEP